MDLLPTENGNKHVIAFQDFLTKWPMVYPLPNQQVIHIAHLFVEEIVPIFDVPEALLLDRCTNLLSQLMLDCCRLLGTKELKTTAYHPESDGMVERFNRTLKNVLQKHVDHFGVQWDRYLGCSELIKTHLISQTERNPYSCCLVLIVAHPQRLYCCLQLRLSLVKFQTTVRSLFCQCHMQEILQSVAFMMPRGNTKHINFCAGDWILIRFPQVISTKAWPLQSLYRVMRQM